MYKSIDLIKTQNQNQKHSKYIIPKRAYEKYNTETCFQIKFTKEGLDLLRKKYRKVRGLPAFIHHLMKGKPTNERDLFLINPNLFSWTQNGSALTIPNLCINLDRLKNNPRILKDDPTEGLALVAWAIDPRLLKNYGWKQEIERNNVDSFKEFLSTNDNTQNVGLSYSFFKRSDSQEEIDKLELTNKETPYLATILDLTSADVEFLKTLKETNLNHLEKNYGVNFQKDTVEMYFHFPYGESTTTLHLHIRVNQGRHPMERARTFSLDEVIDCLENGSKISELVLKRKPHYCNDFEILHNIEGVTMTEIKNPFILTSPIVDSNSNALDDDFNDLEITFFKQVSVQQKLEVENYLKDKTPVDPYGPAAMVVYQKN